MPPLGHPSAGASPNAIRPCEWGPGRHPTHRSSSSVGIAIPVAIIHGDRDRYIPASDAGILYRACSPFGRRLDVVAGMGHAFDAKALPAVKASVEWLLADEKPTTLDAVVLPSPPPRSMTVPGDAARPAMDGSERPRTVGK